MRQESSSAADREVQSREMIAAEAAPPRVHHAGSASARHSSAKIIEFPRFAWGPPAPPPDQLAEPVSGRPRILDVPEVEPPPPALGGITIEAVQHTEVEKRLGIDMPLQSAPFGSRVVAAVVDGLIIAAASASVRLYFLEGRRGAPAAGSNSGTRCCNPGLFLGGLSVSPDRVLRQHSRVARRRPGTGTLRRHCDQSLAAPLARTGRVAFRRFGWNGLRLGVPGRGRTVLARPDYAYVLRAEKVVAPRTRPSASSPKWQRAFFLTLLCYLHWVQP